MFKLDNNFLISMGLGSLPVEEKNRLLQTIYERLEMNVGVRLAERMTEEQLTEFEQFMDRKDEAGALRWLEINFPNYKQVVAEELEKLRNEVSQSAPQILSAIQASMPQSSTLVAPQHQQEIGGAPSPQSTATQANDSFGGPSGGGMHSVNNNPMPSADNRGPSSQPTPHQGIVANDSLVNSSNHSGQSAQTQDFDDSQQRFHAQQPPAGPGTYS